ncbi:gp53-like domain-containing protein [Burkholderia stagnalis]|uniref:gp53-like domain-containing protein n=1 Tax=Burkholderia stagnalis TaxID=1503054 RepID=UPI00075267C6|nr:hypothetical protein [Burkholderia stagnalis]KVO49975.1 hypothetical protein WT18_32345 [Burkholderia stagnalis]KVP01576.1 hypothetical protein WT20_32570 [Burkholderia stagnalis]KVW93613.1 hypothetical protein WT30_20110 [Burkholderia stagnalis]KVX62723.1 hypothetical protein WT33_15695 [Burkholderia stagnalis]KWH79444.1 hypothetical protein WT66_13500 [Burkholderia stagnalis]
MTDLVESSTWTPGIRQFETSDPVEGGPDGIDNVPLRQLANRTRFLKDAHDALAGAQNPYPQYATTSQMQSAIAALVDAAPGALDTLNDLSKALGNDPNFATTMTNALAQKAAIDSPVFTGTPKAPTPPQFDATTRIATMEALRRELGSFSSSSGTGSGISAAATVMTAANVGGFYYFNASSNNQTVKLPDESGLKPGAAITFQKSGAQYALTISTYSASAIIDTTVGLASSITLNAGEFVVLAWSGTYWQCSGTYTQRVGQPFGASTGASGYQRLPSGLLIQWGNSSYGAAQQTFNFPLAFPNFALQVVGSPQNIGSTGFAICVTSKSTFSIQSTSGTGNANYVAIGI